MDFDRLNDIIIDDLVQYLNNKYKIDIYQIIDEEDMQHIMNTFECSFYAAAGYMAESIGPMLSDCIQSKVCDKLKEFGYEQTVSSSGSEEEAGNLEGNRQDGKA